MLWNFFQNVKGGYLTIRTNCTSVYETGLGYNIRLVQYANGSAQIRLYDDPLTLRADNPYEPEDLPPGTVLEPFTGKRVREVDEFPDLEPKTDPLELRRISLARTKRLISEYARAVYWEWFCTFTFDPKKVDRTNYKSCCGKMRTWLKNTRDRKAPDLCFLAVPELHRDMESWHFHVLLANIGKLSFEDSGMIKDGQIIYNIPGWTLGFSTATKVRDTYKIQKYIIKYMTKECHVMSRGEHRYFVSHGLPKPKQSYFLAGKGEEMKQIKEIADNLGLEMTWISHSDGGYTNVTYIELQPPENHYLPDCNES